MPPSDQAGSDRGRASDYSKVIGRRQYSDELLGFRGRMRPRSDDAIPGSNRTRSPMLTLPSVFQQCSPRPEVLATFRGEVADRHPPTGPTADAAGVDHPGKEGVRLLTWGDPYLTAWLEAVRFEPPTETEHRLSG